MLISFEIEFFDEIDQMVMTNKGITYGESLSDAVEKICDYYGADNVSFIKVEGLDEIITIDELKENILN